MAASAEAPLIPRLLRKRLPSKGWDGDEKEQACQRALTRKRIFGAAAHLRLVIFVSLRMEASAEASLKPIWFAARLPASGGGGVVRESACQRALPERQTLRPMVHLSEVTELPLSPSHSLDMPSAV